MALPRLVCALAMLLAGGCASGKYATMRSVPRSPLVDVLKLTASGGPQPTDRTVQLLRVYHLTDDLKGDRRQLLDKLEAIAQREPSSDKTYALAELAYLGGQKAQVTSKEQARHLYGAAVLYAYHYLFDPHFIARRNPYDPQFRGACDLYNGALEAALRIESTNKRLLPGNTATIQTSAGAWDITCQLCASTWRDEDFDHFDFVSNYEITGLRNHYQSYGLGVPLIAVRRSYEGESPAARYYPPGLSFPVTAFLRPLPSPPVAKGAPVRQKALLEMYDPLVADDVEAAQVRVPLESDLTTPLAYFLSNPNFDRLATAGLLNPDFLRNLRPDRPAPIMGLYMVQPYESGKIPVVMVHGLWSSPMTWMEMFNDLRSRPEIRDNYQIWFYLYPTGQPFWISAAQMRHDLAEVRQTLDPEHREPALDQMVLIGHSMGGLVSKMQTVSSNDDYWHTVSQQPIQLIKAEAEVRAKLDYCFYFQPSASIRRVITIGTPHRGSTFSNQTTQWLLGKLINLPQTLVQNQEALFRDNPNAFDGRSLLKIRTSIDSLSPEAPIFPVMLASRRPPWVKYHNIIGLVPNEGLFGRWAAGSDGVVALESARVDGVESELVVPADHTTVHAHPLAVLEVRRILLDHLQELQSFPSERSPVITAQLTPQAARQAPPRTQ